MAPTPPAPRIASILAARNNCLQALRQAHVGVLLQHDRFAAFLDSVCASLSTARRPVIEDSVRYLVGSVLTDEEAIALSWRLAGNLKRLRSGLSAPPWTGQLEEEWAAAQIIEMVAHKREGGEAGYLVQLRILSGSPSGMQLTKFWSKALCYVIASRVGFTNRRGKLPMSYAVELVNLRLLVLFEPRLSTAIRPGFHQVSCPPSYVEHNRSLLKQRLRVGYSCPRGYEHACARCHVGYVDCVAAVHRDTWQPRSAPPPEQLEP